MTLRHRRLDTAKLTVLLAEVIPWLIQMVFQGRFQPPSSLLGIVAYAGYSCGFVFWDLDRMGGRFWSVGHCYSPSLTLGSRLPNMRKPYEGTLELSTTLPTCPSDQAYPQAPGKYSDLAVRVVLGGKAISQ